MSKLKADSELKSKYRCIKVNGRKKEEHRYIMEKILGRPLRADEIVHHIDENKLNNDPSNLEVMSRSEHARLHRRGKPLSDITKARIKNKTLQNLRENKVVVVKSRPVCAYDAKTGKLIKSYRSINAATHDGFDDWSILLCLKGRRKTHKGMIWKDA